MENKTGQDGLIRDTGKKCTMLSLLFLEARALRRPFETGGTVDVDRLTPLCPFKMGATKTLPGKRSRVVMEPNR